MLHKETITDTDIETIDNLLDNAKKSLHEQDIDGFIESISLITMFIDYDYECIYDPNKDKLIN